MKIDSIRNGIVIDHITAGKAMKLYELLRLQSVDASVAILMNVVSQKMGRKDIIKIDAEIPVDLDVIGVVSPEEGSVARVCSQGFSPCVADLAELDPKKEERGKSVSLVRGVARGFRERGLAPGAFSAYTESRVPRGGGVSSSAAFEVLLGCMQDALFHGGGLPPLEIAKIAQKAERDFFGKPCGLMDQAACAAGGICMMDFAREEEPYLERIPFSFEEAGYRIYLVKVGGDHADLTHLYAAIPRNMKKVASLFGKEKLRDVPEEEILSHLPRIREKAGDEAGLAALHFCFENRRVRRERDALLSGSVKDFLKEVRASGHSSFEALGNVRIPGEVMQGASVALTLSSEILREDGAWRIHGGGFGGTTQHFVPLSKAPVFQQRMEEVFGPGQAISIRPVGPVRIL